MIPINDKTGRRAVTDPPDKVDEAHIVPKPTQCGIHIVSVHGIAGLPEFQKFDTSALCRVHIVLIASCRQMSHHQHHGFGHSSTAHKILLVAINYPRK